MVLYVKSVFILLFRACQYKTGSGTSEGLNKVVRATYTIFSLYKQMHWHNRSRVWHFVGTQVAYMTIVNVLLVPSRRTDKSVAEYPKTDATAVELTVRLPHIPDLI